MVLLLTIGTKQYKAETIFGFALPKNSVASFVFSKLIMYFNFFQMYEESPEAGRCWGTIQYMYKLQKSMLYSKI
jgi:hypothetical protein